MNYLAQDRPDLAFARMRASQRMAKPMESDWALLKRIGRYLRCAPRLVINFPWQEEPQMLSVFTDSGWGGCVRTRRSTSGGVILHGKHLIKHWSKLQTTVALSSGEAEIYACNKGASEGIGISQMCADFDVEKQVHMFTDASACKGAIMRRGTGRLKHIQVQELWLQECVRRGLIIVHKIGREDNCSDLLTHHWTAREAGNHLQKMGCKTSL